MEVVICKTKEEASAVAAQMIVDQVKANAASVLGLATGSTPIALYRELIKANASGAVSFKQVKSWNLDEYVGLKGDHPQSYRYFMDDNLFNHIDINKENTHVLNGLAADWRQECADYEKAIKAAGGIDIQVLGIGSDGHIAFNEPGSSLVSRTRRVALTPGTVQDNARFFEKAADVPRYALSLGVGTICEARKVLLLAFGKNKAAAVAAAVEGGVSQFCTASALQMHPDAWFFCDEEAAAGLKLKEYYSWRAKGELERA